MSALDTAELWVLGGDGSLDRVSLAGRTQFVIGRAEDADHRIDRPGLDRRHVHLTVHDGAWWIVGGTATTTGTWLSGRFVLESRRLVDGDVIQLGEVRDVLVRYQDGGGGVPTAPPRFDRGVDITPQEAAARGLPRVGLRCERPEGLMAMASHDDRTWVTLTSPPGGGPHARFMRGPRLDERPNAPRALLEAIDERARPEAIASGRVLAFGGAHAAIVWVWGESLARSLTLAVAAPIEETKDEALVLAFSCRATGGLEPWLVLTHPSLAPLLAARLSR